MNNNKRYTFMALSPFTIMEKGEKRSFSAGDSFIVEGEDTASYYIGETSPYAERVLLIEAVGGEDMKESKSETFFNEVSKMTEPTPSAENVKEVADEVEIQPNGEALISEKPQTFTESKQEESEVKSIRRKK